MDIWENVDKVEAVAALLYRGMVSLGILNLDILWEGIHPAWTEKYRNFVKYLISELHRPETMSLCNEPGCITCRRDCVWKFNNQEELKGEK